MKKDYGFFKTTMPTTRKADFYLGCLGGAVFLDFNVTDEKLIYLCRISFDGYGCCYLKGKVNLLNAIQSKRFLEEIDKDDLNQKIITPLIKEMIKINKELIWNDAIEEYQLIDIPINSNTPTDLDPPNLI